MSTDAVSRSSNTNAVAPYTGPLAANLAAARAINARPATIQNDHYFVHEVLGKDLVTAKAEYRRLVKLFHTDGKESQCTPAELGELENAFKRVKQCWDASDDGKNIKAPGALEFAVKTGAAVSSVIIIMQAADYGLRQMRETYQRKVADGTVDRVKGTAADLFAGVSKLAAAGWQAAVSRKTAKKD